MKDLKFLVIVCCILCLINCGKSNPITNDDDDDDSLLVFGEESTLEIVTWNIQEFPKEGQTTINKVEKIIKDSEVDIFAIQEITDTNSFNQMVANLSEYEGLYSEDTYNGYYLKTGIIYKKDIVEIKSCSQLFWGDWYAFTRPPLLLEIKSEFNDNIFDFNLIIIHLKSGGWWEEIDRRRAAACSLKNYIDEKVSTEEEKDYIVAGDWNDEIDDPKDENSFNVFIADSTNYKFLTWPIAGNQYYASWPHYPYYSLIDHILISKDCFDEFGNGSIETLRLDDFIYNYFDTISDHRPVMAKFPVFK
ncbi:MAG: endonuclease/exonuclease/phosphatase family protein [Candidatus Cloacimonetes bacterium]|nr:endonuclease/exonuclease/phosphatase family protein [Candidatus Cloacimonadota bacterium]